jgi:hypothetical protein
VKHEVFWDVAQCEFCYLLVFIMFLVADSFNRDDGGDMLDQNVGSNRPIRRHISDNDIFMITSFEEI